MNSHFTPTTRDRARAALAVEECAMHYLIDCDAEKLREWTSDARHREDNSAFLCWDAADRRLAALEAAGLAVVDAERLERLRAAATAAEPYCWTHWAAACEVLRPGDIDPLPATAAQEEGR